MGLDGIWVDDSNTKGRTEKNTTDVGDNRVGTTAISITELGNCSLVHLFRSHAVSVSLPGHTGTLLTQGPVLHNRQVNKQCYFCNKDEIIMH